MINHAKILITALLATVALSGYAQNYVSIKDETGYRNDSIRFIVSGSLHDKKPVLLFMQGSGNMSIFKQADDGQYLAAIAGYSYDNYKDKYHIVIISKPGVPLVTPDDRPVPWDNNTTYCSDYFWENDVKDYHVAAAAEVLKYLHRQSYADTSRIILMGHSQGAAVAAKVASLYPQLVTRLIYMSSSIFGRSFQEITDAYISMYRGEATHEQVIKKSGEIYAALEQSKNATPDSAWYYTHRSNLSFNYDPSVKYLTKTQVPVLVVYGTADTKSNDCSYLPLFMLNSDTKYTMRPYAGYDHSYFTVDESGRPDYDKWNWDAVFTDAVNWAETDSVVEPAPDHLSF